MYTDIVFEIWIFTPQFHTSLLTAILFSVMFKLLEYSIIYVNRTFMYFFAVHQDIFGIVISIFILNEIISVIIFPAIIIRII